MSNLILPPTGAAWGASGLNFFRTNRIRRGGRVAAMVRDYNGASTAMGPYSFSPFAEDGQPRTDLLAVIQDPANPGKVKVNPNPNLGWYLIEMLDPKGFDMSPDMSTDKLEGLQTNATVRSDVQKEGESFNFMAMQSTTLTDALRNNRPLSSLLPDGFPGYSATKLADAITIDRQFLFIRIDLADGLPEYTAYGYARSALDKNDKSTVDKKTADGLAQTWDSLLDPYSVDVDGQSEIMGRIVWRDGQGWRAAGDPPVFSAAPVASPVTGLKATIVIPVAAGTAFTSPTYSVTQYAGGLLTGTAATLQGSPSISGGNVTLTVTGLTASTAYVFTVTAVGAGSVSATSLPSAPITSTAS
ncbi:hypothetical protein [Mycolicibacterium brisbanense]|uniref:Major tail subunit n=1 Tax=Mycolicibacterium brisbanense TaxID=146020 RepID=A0A124E164_9MYCO|nr:hypothetical protein [Mycolicibacterium brisbanense]MCV7158039.1 hypothetical protein [Mycolicibacterium brisbanense]GAS92689.1 major tail subunit [Mycolicibacterium brisbanense]